MFHVTPLKALKYAITSPDSSPLLTAAVILFIASGAALYFGSVSEGLQVFLGFLAVFCVSIVAYLIVSGYRLCYAMKGKLVEVDRKKRLLSPHGDAAGWAIAGGTATAHTGLPAYNVDGTPMIEGANIDVSGHAYGHIDTDSGMNAGSIGSYHSPFDS